MSTTTYIFVYYTFEGPEHEYSFEESDSSDSDVGSGYEGAMDEESLVTRRSPSSLPSLASLELSSASSSDSLSSYETCSDFQVGPLPDPDPIPWYLRPTPSPVFPTSPSFEWELSFHTAVGGNDSLFFDGEDKAALFPQQCVTDPALFENEVATPRCADFDDRIVKMEEVSPLLCWDGFNAMQRTSSGDSGTPVNESRSPTGSCDGSDAGWAPGKSPSQASESCGWSSDGGYKADSESRLASAALERRRASSRLGRKRTNLKRKRDHRDEDAGGVRVFGPGGHFDGGDEGPAPKKRKADPPVERVGWQEEMKKMHEADSGLGGAIPGEAFLQMVLHALKRL